MLQFNNQDHSFGTNVRLFWEYKPLSYLYMIYNGVRPFNNTDPVNVVGTYNQIGFKLSYLISSEYSNYGHGSHTNLHEPTYWHSVLSDPDFMLKFKF